MVRGYLIGSGWKDYQRDGAVCGIALPKGLRLADRLPEPIFTPATKAPSGSTMRTSDFEAVVQLVGRQRAEQVREKTDRALSLRRRLRRDARHHHCRYQVRVRHRRAGNLVLIDEVLTPDSSRFWPADTWKPGSSPPSFDKQFVRDYLETLDWNKRAPGPHLPPEIIAKTSEKYREPRALTTSELHTE